MLALLRPGWRSISGSLPALADWGVKKVSEYLLSLGWKNRFLNRKFLISFHFVLTWIDPAECFREAAAWSLGLPDPAHCNRNLFTTGRKLSNPGSGIFVTENEEVSESFNHLGAEEPGQDQVLVVGGECLFSPTDKLPFSSSSKSASEMPTLTGAFNLPAERQAAASSNCSPLGLWHGLVQSTFLYINPLCLHNSPMRKGWDFPAGPVVGRICLSMQGTWLRSLVLDDFTCCGATKAASCTCWNQHAWRLCFAIRGAAVSPRLHN